MFVLTVPILLTSLFGTIASIGRVGAQPLLRNDTTDYNSTEDLGSLYHGRSARNIQPSCPGTSTQFNTAILDPERYLTGAWGSYYVGYTKTDNQSPTSLHFDRLDAAIDITMTSERDQPANDRDSNYVPNWKTSFGPAAFTWKLPLTKEDWQNYLFFEWTFRLVPPCTGNYFFQAADADDGVALYIGGDLKTNTLWPGEWVATPSKTRESADPVQLIANTMYTARMIGFEGYGHVVQRLRWKLPGSTEYSAITNGFIAAHAAPTVYVSRNNVISFRSQTGVEEFFVRLSERPTGTVTVTLDNAAGKDMFGFDKCVLHFDETNWNQEQIVYSAPLPGAKRTVPAGSITPVALVPTQDAAKKIYAPGSLQVLEPSTGGGNQNAICSGWGDPHYTTFDGRSFNAYMQGTYYLARDFPGSFAVVTVLRKCDDTATVSCTKLTYIKYKSSFFQVWMNPGPTSEDAKDGTPLWTKLLGTGDGVVVDRPDDNTVRFTIPGGLSVDVKVGFFKTWQADPKLWWRYHNVYVSASDKWMNSLTGLCGTYDGNPTNDETDQTKLVQAFTVPDNVITSNGVEGVTPLTPPISPPVPPYMYSTTTTIDKFVFDPQCSGTGVPPNPESPGPNVPPPVEPVDPTYNPQSPAPPGNKDIADLCITLIDRARCPGATVVTMSDTWITQQRTLCESEADAAKLVKPFPPADKLTTLTDSFDELCKAIQDNKEASLCAACKANQACVRGECVSSGLECGAPCVTGACDAATGLCVCPAGFSGKYCEIRPTPDTILCAIPTASALGPFLAAVISNNLCALGSYITVGQTCAVQCANGASGSGVQFTCKPDGTLDKDLFTAIQCEKDSTCTDALARALFPPCATPATVFMPAQQCKLGSPSSPRVAPCGTSTCCRARTQCGAFSCASSGIPGVVNNADMASRYCDDADPNNKCVDKCCRPLTKCSAYTCDPASLYANSAASGAYCDPLTSGSCVSTCCIPKRTCSQVTCLPKYSNTGASVLCEGESDCYSKCCSPNPCSTLPLTKDKSAGTCTPNRFPLASGDSCAIACDAAYVAVGNGDGTVTCKLGEFSYANPNTPLECQLRCTSACANIPGYQMKQSASAASCAAGEDCTAKCCEPVPSATCAALFPTCSDPTKEPSTATTCQPTPNCEPSKCCSDALCCGPKRCQSAPSVPNSSPTSECTAVTPLASGSSCTVTCLPGFSDPAGTTTFSYLCDAGTLGPNPPGTTPVCSQQCSSFDCSANGGLVANPDAPATSVCENADDCKAKCCVRPPSTCGKEAVVCQDTFVRSDNRTCIVVDSTHPAGPQSCVPGVCCDPSNPAPPPFPTTCADFDDCSARYYKAVSNRTVCKDQTSCTRTCCARVTNCSSSAFTCPSGSQPITPRPSTSCAAQPCLGTKCQSVKQCSSVCCKATTCEPGASKLPAYQCMQSGTVWAAVRLVNNNTQCVSSNGKDCQVFANRSSCATRAKEATCYPTTRNKPVTCTADKYTCNSLCTAGLKFFKLGDRVQNVCWVPAPECGGKGTTYSVRKTYDGYVECASRDRRTCINTGKAGSTAPPATVTGTVRCTARQCTTRSHWCYAASQALSGAKTR